MARGILDRLELLSQRLPAMVVDGERDLHSPDLELVMAGDDAVECHEVGEEA